MQGKDIRLIDEYGQPNYHGRLEIRSNGQWFSVKSLKGD